MTSKEERADAIVGKLRERVERGEEPDFEAVLAEHAELEGELRPRLAIFRLLDDAYDELRSTDIGPLIPPIGKGTRLGPYRLDHPLGAGGMGTVYLARVEERTPRLETGLTVAVKVIHPHLMLRKDVVTRFKREAEIGRRVDHENVVATLDTGSVEHGGTRFHYLVTEYVEGRTLRELADEMRKVPEGLLSLIAQQASAGLAAIHASKIVHRDLKPENVLLTMDNRVRIMDLGMARLVDASVQLTQDGQFAGSLLYAAPEHLRGDKVGPAADLYGLGLLLYELLSGSRPFTQDQVAACLRSRIAPTPPSLQDRGTEVSSFFSEVIHTLLANDPKDRFASAKELEQVLIAGETSAWWAAQATVGSGGSIRVQVPVTRRVRLRGRDSELEQLRQCWGRARGGLGCVVLLSGESGIGKTRLLAEMMAEVQEAETLYTTFAPSGSVGSITDALIERLGMAGLEEALRPYLRQAPGLATMIARFARHELTPTAPTAIGGEGLAAGLVRLLQGMAQSNPVLWVMEDVEVASAEARAIVLALARAVQDLPGLVLLTSAERPSESDLEALSRLERFERLRLGRLQDRDVRLILDEVFDDDVAVGPLERELTRRVDGVPFFLFELLRGLESDGTLRRGENGRYAVTDRTRPIALPATLRHMVRARLARLTPEQRTLVDLAAVQGFQFDAYLLSDVLDRAPIAALRELAEIERRSGVIRTSGRVHRFDHPLLQEVVYEELAPELRAESHDRLARTREQREDVVVRSPNELPAETVLFLARHHLRGPDPKAARPYLQPALDQLASAFREEDALALTERALRVDGLLEGEERARFLVHRAERLRLLGKHEEELRALQEADELVRGLHAPRLRAETALKLGRALLIGRRTEAAESALQIAHEASVELGDVELQAAALESRGNAALHSGRYLDALECYEESLELAKAHDNAKQELRTRTQFGVALKALERLDDAVAQHERCITLARKLGDLRAEGMATGNLGVALYRLGRVEDARGCQERRLKIAQEVGDLVGEAKACGNLGNICMATGDLDEARRWHERDLQIMREVGDFPGERMASGNLASAWMRLGRRDQARLVIEDQISRCRASRNARGIPHGMARLAWLSRDEGRYAEADHLLLQAMQLDRDAGDRLVEAEHQAAHALILAEIGELPSAGEQARAAIDALRELDAPRSLGAALVHDGQVSAAMGDGERQDACLREAHELLGRVEHPFALTECLAWLGTRAIERGDEAEARRLLGEAKARGESARLGIAVVMATSGLVTLGDLDPADATTLLEAWEQLTPVVHLLRARHALFVRTSASAHLREARRLLQQIVSGAPKRCQQTIIDAVPLYRAVYRA